MRDENKQRYLTVRIPDDIKKWLGHRAVDKGTNVSMEVIDIIREKMQEEPIEG